MSASLFDPTRVYDDAALAPHTPGQRLKDHRGYEYAFIRANNANITAHHTCVIQGNGLTARLTTTTTADVGRLCGIAFVAIPHNSYGWLCIWGAGLINVAASCTADNHLYTTTTAGRLDDATGQARITNIGLTSNRGGTAGNQNAIWHYPVCD